MFDNEIFSVGKLPVEVDMESVSALSEPYDFGSPSSSRNVSVVHPQMQRITVSEYVDKITITTNEEMITNELESYTSAKETDTFSLEPSPPPLPERLYLGMKLLLYKQLMIIIITIIINSEREK